MAGVDALIFVIGHNKLAIEAHFDIKNEPVTILLALGKGMQAGIFVISFQKVCSVFCASS